MSETESANMLGLTARIVAAHVENNHVAAEALPDMIQSVYQSLAMAGAPEDAHEEPPIPAVPVKRSVFPDFIVCLDDGKKLKMLKRHLQTRYGMTAADYRAKWGLPHDYPMVAPNYAATRSGLAKSIGLGRKLSLEPAASEGASSKESAVTMVPARRARGSKG